MTYAKTPPKCRLIALVALAVHACTLPGAVAQPLDTIVTTASGTVVGNPRDASGILSYKGIPYATRASPTRHRPRAICAGRSPNRFNRGRARMGHGHAA